MWENIKSMFRWAWKRIKKHPYLTVFSISALALTGYLFILPMMGDAIAITPSVVGIAAATCTFGGILLGNILGWVGQKIGFIKRDPISISPPDPSKREAKLEKLPPEIKNVVFSFLTPKERAMMKTDICRVNLFFDSEFVTKFLRHIDRGEAGEAEKMLVNTGKIQTQIKLLATRGTVTSLSGQIFTGTAIELAVQTKDDGIWKWLKPYLPKKDKFLHHVAHGEQHEAEMMLQEEAETMQPGSGKGEKKERAILSKLLTTKGTVTDLSDRTFTDITALQYTLWAKDRHMWEMLEKYLPPDEALKQYEEHKKNGVSYSEQGGKTRIKEAKHYNIVSPLQTAIENYENYQKDHHNDRQYRDTSNKLWLNIGLVQRDVPEHVASQYCSHSAFGDFSKWRNFDATDLPRLKNPRDWFPNPKLGVRFPVCRHSKYSAQQLMPLSHFMPYTQKDPRDWRETINLNLQWHIDLDNARTQDYIKLGERLRRRKAELDSPTNPEVKPEVKREETKEVKEEETKDDAPSSPRPL